MLGNFTYFLLSADYLQIQRFQKKFRTTIRVSNSLDLDQGPHFVEPDLGPNCLQRIAAYHSSNEWINLKETRVIALV